MKQRTKFVVTLATTFLLCASANVQAKKEKKEKRFPRGCSQTGYQFDYFNVILNTDNDPNPRAIFFIHNLSSQTVKLRQSQTGDEPYIIQSRTTIKPNRWAVFAAAMKTIKFICTNKSSNDLHDKVISCKNVLDICEYARVKFGDNNGGNYWVTTNNTRKGSVRKVVYHGILLRGL